MTKLQIGDVVWQMRGRRRNKEIKWSAEPKCVEKMDRHGYFFGSGEGCSYNSVGKSVFLSRDAAIEDFLKRYGSLSMSIGIDEPTPKGCTELPRTDWQEYRVPRFDGVNKTSVYLNGFGDLIKYTDKLDWHKENNNNEPPYYEEETEHLTLTEIYEQVHIREDFGELCPLITVFVNGPMRTEVFQCNNYDIGKWVRLGDFMGYA